MAAVLFIVSIPTEAEEERLKQEFISRKYDIKSDQSDNAVPLPKGENGTTPSISNDGVPSTTPTTSLTTTAIQSDKADTLTPSIASEDNANSGDADFLKAAIQYGTFPKRRKSEHQPKLVETSVSIGGSLKNVDMNTPNGIPGRRKSWVRGIHDTLSSTKQKTSKKKDPPADTALTYNTCMETVLRVILKKLQIQNVMWTKDDEGRMYQICFTVEFNETYEKILDNFNEWGIGDREGSTVSVMNCIASKAFTSKEDDDEENDDNADNNLDQKQGAWDRFMNSVRSRLNVTQIVQNVRQDAAITFDFVVLLISAAILAAFGLIEDSTIFLASSMLISPLMGPIIGTIFGTVIKDNSLFRLGMKNELFGICIAILVGFAFGIIMCVTDHRYGIGEGLTSEMLSRCELHSLIVGVFTAIPSGAAAAIGILGGNIGSLVGVAISASLLPPAVNSGLLWSIALVYKIYENDDSKYTQVVKSTQYSDNQANELAVLASISMCLTISNIICIYIMGILVLKVKEIAPVISDNNREFWKHDIKIARHLKRTRFDSENVIIDEFANLAQEDQKALGINYDILRNMNMDDAAYQNTWSPRGTRHPFETSYEPMLGNYSTVHPMDKLYSTVHPLDKLYTTITHQTSMMDKRNRFGLTRRATGRLPDFGTSYKLLSENIPRCSTMPSKAAAPTVTIVTPSSSKYTSCTNTPTGMADEKKRRKFIVTPAEDDPLQPLNPSDA